jgi:low affinity Fe/Cu permease
MAELIHEIGGLEHFDWLYLILVITLLIAGLAVILVMLLRGLRQIKLTFGKDGVRLNESANGKLDYIIGKIDKLERDVVALQIMNEHLSPDERLKIYDYYKQELHGNSFIDEYIKAIKGQIDVSRFS